jgi:hypothetical protein
MLRATTEAYFTRYDNRELFKQINQLTGQAINFSGRRNEIAHGVVGFWYPKPPAFFMIEEGARTFFLTPSYADSSKRDVQHLPQYAYTSKEINYYADEFQKLSRTVGSVLAKILGFRTYLRTRPSPTG